MYHSLASSSVGWRAFGKGNEFYLESEEKQPLEGSASEKYSPLSWDVSSGTF